jgi:hypothetical protein
MSSSNPLQAPSHVLALLDKLHSLSLDQEGKINKSEVQSTGHKKYMKDKFIALEQDKCLFVYQLALAIGAQNIVEVCVTLL